LDNNITKDGVTRPKMMAWSRQMFNCGKGKHRFSETVTGDLFGKHGSFKRIRTNEQVKLLWLTADAIADVLSKIPEPLATLERV